MRRVVVTEEQRYGPRRLRVNDDDNNFVKSGQVMSVNANFNMAATTIMNFIGKSDCGISFSTYISNSVQMRAKMAKLWPKM